MLKCQETMIIQQETWILDHQNYCKLVYIDISRQTNTITPQQIDFIGKLEKDDRAAIFVMAEKQQKFILNLSLDLLNLIGKYKQWNIKYKIY